MNRTANSTDFPAAFPDVIPGVQATWRALRISAFVLAAILVVAYNSADRLLPGVQALVASAVPGALPSTAASPESESESEPEPESRAPAQPEPPVPESPAPAPTERATVAAPRTESSSPGPAPGAPVQPSSSTGEARDSIPRTAPSSPLNSPPNNPVELDLTDDAADTAGRPPQSEAPPVRTAANPALDTPAAEELASLQELRRIELVEMTEDASRIDFAVGRAELDAPIRRQLDRIFETLYLYQDTSIGVRVTVPEGSDEPGRRLAGARARALVGYLVERGLDRERFTVDTPGSEAPDEGRSRVYFDTGKGID